MKQSFFISFILIIFVAVFGSKSYSGNEVEIISDGNSIYKTSLKEKHVIWVVDNKIYEDDEIITTFNLIDVDLYDPTNIDISTIDANEVNMLIIDEGVDMYEANCKDKICVKKGSISKSGQTIVCAPHKLVIQINGASSLDA
jgi:hypothetical protein